VKGYFSKDEIVRKIFFYQNIQCVNDYCKIILNVVIYLLYSLSHITVFIVFNKTKKKTFFKLMMEHKIFEILQIGREKKYWKKTDIHYNVKY
jgi:hypothetical protein